MPQKLYELLMKHYKKIYYNRVQIQNINSILCGYYCIAFLKSMNNTNDSNFLKTFDAFVFLFNKDTKKNDKILKKYLKA